MESKPTFRHSCIQALWFPPTPPRYLHGVPSWAMLSAVTALYSSAASLPVSAKVQPCPQKFLNTPRNCIYPQ